jgi:TetR/AcrR family transcriptional regulator, transcriptional repressor for nem operon
MSSSKLAYLPYAKIPWHSLIPHHFTSPRHTLSVLLYLSLQSRQGKQSRVHDRRLFKELAASCRITRFSRTRQTAERILKAANALMTDRGYSAFSYADISETVDIRKASIHHHFPTKADLATAVLRAHRGQLVQGTKLIDQQIKDPLARIQAYVQYWEGCIRGRTMAFCIAALLGAEMPSLPEEVQREVRLHFKALSEWLEKTLKAGVQERVIKLQEPAAIEAQTLMAVVHGAMLSARATSNCDVFKTVTDAALKRISAQSSMNAKHV